LSQIRAAAATLGTFSITKPLLIPRSRGFEAPLIRNGAPAVRARVIEERCSGVAGLVIATRRVPGFQVVETHHPIRLEVARHFHEHAHLIYVLEGQYSEAYDGAPAVVCVPPAVRYLPARHPHSNTFEAGSRCMIVEIEPEMLNRVQKHSQALQRPGQIEGPATTWLSQRMVQEFRQGDRVAMVSLQGVLLEMLSESARHAGSGPFRMVPDWLRRVKGHLEANFLRQLTLAEMAGVAHVHRVHLARQFRRYFSTTVGQFLRRKRIEHACHLVTTTKTSLTDIAMDCGFSDQSHFSAAFRKQMGLTPARFRQLAQAR
jgi:AraC family transcriptional regulator